MLSGQKYSLSSSHFKNFDKHSMKEINIIGLMSGTSLDGLDIACVKFRYDLQWTYTVIALKTVCYDEKLRNSLKQAMFLSGIELVTLNVQLGKWFGQQCEVFLFEKGISKKSISAIASHGHTVFHQPNAGITFQLGSGAEIAAQTGITTVCDFRTLDVALKGQGAPLVPIGDQLLFGDYRYCLNLGGIANISFEQDSERISFDCCLANIVSNYLVHEKGLSYDHGGQLASAGEVNEVLLQRMNECPYFLQSQPKSLGIEFFNAIFKSILDISNASVEDKLKTFAVHLAQQVGRVAQTDTLLVTGGGAYNKTWIELIQQYSNAEVVVPDDDTINFKEAIIFAFLGVLRLEGQNNAMKSVTGALRDNSGGAIYLGK
jgi:anhydro-N-acetylmuramic acid kinase